MAHAPNELALHRTLEDLYLKPIQTFIEKNKGYVYTDSTLGNRPDPSTYTTYPAFIGFDGELNKEYNAEALSRIVMMSDALKNIPNGMEKGSYRRPNGIHYKK